MTPEHINSSIARALKGESGLDAETLAVKGFSTPAIRHLLNRLCEIPGSTYLEVGAWFGGSACAAACNNQHLTSYVVENFAQDFSANNVRETLLRNLEVVRPKTGRLEFIEKDCYSFDLAEIDDPISVFFFDSEHSRESQAKALPHFLPVMRGRFVYLVDDFSWEPVRAGCRQGIEELSGKITIEHEWVLTGKRANDDPVWWNGLYIAMIAKTPPAEDQNRASSDSKLTACEPAKS